MIDPLHSNDQGRNDPPQSDREKVLGYGCVLPCDNEPEFAELEGMLGQLKVPFRRIDVIGDGVMYLIDECELPKLPRDGDEKPFMPGEDGTGHGLVKIRQKYLDLMTDNGRTMRSQ
jgi:hypothetical protein